MRLRHASLLLAMLLSGGALFNVSAAVIWNESVMGDLSNSGLSPTLIGVSPGSNQILGSTGRTTAVDRDYFTINIPVGLQLTSVTVLPGTTSGGALGFSFIGMQAGSQVTLPVNTATAAGLLGWWHYTAADVSSDILSKMAIPVNGASGFTSPLASGTYSFWVQDFDPGPLPYGFDFQITSVPEPGTWVTLISGLTLFAAAARRRTA